MVEKIKGAKGEGQGLKERDAERIKLLLVDDHPMVREGMRRLLEGYRPTEEGPPLFEGVRGLSLQKLLPPALAPLWGMLGNGVSACELR